MAPTTDYLIILQPAQQTTHVDRLFKKKSDRLLDAVGGAIERAVPVALVIQPLPLIHGPRSAFEMFKLKLILSKFKITCEHPKQTCCHGCLTSIQHLNFKT